MKYSWMTRVNEFSKSGKIREEIDFPDSIEHKIKTEILEMRLRKGLFQEELEDIDGLRQASEEALEVATQLGDKIGLQKAYVLKAYYALVTSNIKEGKRFIDKAMELEKGKNEDLVSGEIHYLKGIFHYLNHEIEKAITHLEKAIVIRKALGEMKLVAQALNAKAIIFEKAGDIQSSIRDYKRSLEIKEKERDALSLARGHHDISSLYYSIGELTKASKHIEKSIEISRHINSGQINHANFIKALIEYSKGNFELSLLLVNDCIDYFSKREDVSALMKAYQLKNSILMEKKGDRTELEQKVDRLLQKNPQNRELQIEKNIFKAKNLISNKRPQAKFSAYDLLDSVIDQDEGFTPAKLRAMVLKCTLLLEEIEAYPNEVAIQQLQNLAREILQFGERQKSPIHRIRGLMFLGKLKIIEQDTNEGLKWLQMAFDIAEKKGLVQLTKIISIEYKKIKQLSGHTEASSNLQHFNNHMFKPNHEEIISHSKEKPIMIVLINRSGIAKYSKLINHDTLNVDLIASFISAMQAFLVEAFNRKEQLRYISNENYGLVFEEFDGNTICYVFIGNPYHPLQKITILKEKIVRLGIETSINQKEILSEEIKTKIDAILEEIIF